MRHFSRSFFFLILSLFFCSAVSAADGHEIKLKITGVRDTTVYFGFHMGDKNYVSDTVKIDHNGRGVIKGDTALPGGIYLVVMPNKSYFEVLINDQMFAVETDTSDIYGKMKTTGSQDNIMFCDF